MTITATILQIAVNSVHGFLSPYRGDAVGGVKQSSAILEYNLLYTAWQFSAWVHEDHFRRQIQAIILWKTVPELIVFESRCPKTGYSRNEVHWVRHHRSTVAINQPPVHCNQGQPRLSTWQTWRLNHHRYMAWKEDNRSCYLWHVRPVTGIISPPVSSRSLDILQPPAVCSIVITSALFGSQSQSIPSCILALHSSSRCWVMWTKTSCTISLAFLQVPPRPSTTHSSRLSVNRDKLYSTTSLALIDNHKWSFSLTSLDSEIGCM